MKKQTSQGKEIYSEAPSKKLNAEFFRLEFHRSAVALLPRPSDSDPGTAMAAMDRRDDPAGFSCNCEEYSGSCRHTKELALLLEKFPQLVEFDLEFKGSLWHRLGSFCAVGSRETLQTVKMQLVDVKNGSRAEARTSDSRLLFSLDQETGPLSRFIERCLDMPGEDPAYARHQVLQELSRLAISENERIMIEHGVKSRRQAFEEGIWHLLAYHLFREYGPTTVELQPFIEDESGDFRVECILSGTGVRLQFVVPGKRAPAFLQEFDVEIRGLSGAAIEPAPAQMLSSVGKNIEGQIEIFRSIRVLTADRSTRTYDAGVFEKYQYGNLIYVKEMGILARLENEETWAKAVQRAGRKTHSKAAIRLAEEEPGEKGIDPRDLKILRHGDRLIIVPREENRPSPGDLL